MPVGWAPSWQFLILIFSPPISTILLGSSHTQQLIICMFFACSILTPVCKFIPIILESIPSSLVPAKCMPMFLASVPPDTIRFIIFTPFTPVSTFIAASALRATNLLPPPGPNNSFIPFTSILLRIPGFNPLNVTLCLLITMGASSTKSPSGITTTPPSEGKEAIALLMAFEQSVFPSPTAPNVVTSPSISVWVP